MKTEQPKVEDIIIGAFYQVGNDLGDLLYNEEMMKSCFSRNTAIEIYHDFITEELDLILEESCKQLLIKIKLALCGHKKKYENDMSREGVYIL